MISDVILIIISTIWFINSLTKILKGQSNSLGDYVICLIYFFNCFPIVLNLIIGLPKYELYPWFNWFIISSNDSLVQIVYDWYVIIVLIFIKIYLYLSKDNEIFNSVYLKSNSMILTGKNLLLISLLPFIFVLFFGNFSSYTVFQPALSRGLTGSQYSILMIGEYIGLFSFYCWFFENKSNKKLHSYFWLVLYSFLILWIDGKRYLIPTVLLMALYFYTHSIYSEKKRLPLVPIFISFGSLFILFYIFYTLSFKVSSISHYDIQDLMYLSFRIDFGRDDVTKFVLFKEVIENKMILEYRGQTFLSALLFFIPRTIWPTKPYPHYRYLTASLYDSSVLKIPAGMTPSIFEMNIANFGVFFGIIATCFLIVWILNLADKNNTVPMKLLFLILIVGLLTQSIDALIGIVLLLLGNRFFKNLRFGNIKL